MSGPVDTETGFPMSREAEMSVLGSIIYDNSMIDPVREILSPEDFAFPAHRVIYRAILDLRMQGLSDIDLVILKDELQKRKQIDFCGGSKYLVTLVHTVPVPNNALVYAKTVKEKALLRNLIGVATNTIAAAKNQTEDVNELIDKAQNAIFSIAAKRRIGEIRPFGDVMNETFREIQDIHDRKSRLIGIPTGFYEIDDLISGLQAGQLYIVAGRPSMGKTSLVLKMMENISLKEQKPVLFFSLEMSSSVIVHQMLCSHARVDSRLLRSGRIGEEDFKRLILAGSSLQDAHIFIDDNSDLSIIDIRSRARRFKAEKNIEAVFVDYLQLVRVPADVRRRNDSREREVAYVSSQLKAMSKELEIPVIVVSQLNRKPDTRRDYRPKLSDLRESGSLEQDADVVMLLFRPEAYNKDTDETGICYVDIAKNRLGPIGEVRLVFLREYTRFENIAVNPT
jgi:replicative DNA helicase